jgi:hypothetical protein
MSIGTPSFPGATQASSGSTIVKVGDTEFVPGLVNNPEMLDALPSGWVWRKVAVLAGNNGGSPLGLNGFGELIASTGEVYVEDHAGVSQSDVPGAVVTAMAIAPGRRATLYFYFAVPDSVRSPLFVFGNLAANDALNACLRWYLCGRTFLGCKQLCVH